MRRFTLGSAPDRKIVVIELSGTRMSVVQMLPDGSTKRSERDFESEAEARSASDRMARELISRGYAEPVARGPKPASTGAVAPKPAARAREHEGVGRNRVFDDVKTPGATEAPVLARLASAPGAKASADDAPQKKKKAGGKKKKQKKSQSGDALDKRVLAGVGAVVVVFIGIIAFIVYDIFIKPPTIVGVWRGGMVEHEISRSLTLTQYDLILDDRRRAALTLQAPGAESTTLVGTYVVKGNRLQLAVKDEDGDPSDREYKISLGRVTLELYDPESGKLLVQLIRFRETPVVRAHAPRRTKPPEPTARDAATVDESDE